MSSLEKRAWLTLWSMCPPYCVYFVIQFGFPSLLPTMQVHIACLAAAASVHAIAYVSGLLLIKRRETDEELLHDERDRAIDARATRAAYFMLLTGMILVGVVMPFGSGSRGVPPSDLAYIWKLVNAALFFIVLSETLRVTLTVYGYRRTRFAH